MCRLAIRVEGEGVGTAGDEAKVAALIEENDAALCRYQARAPGGAVGRSHGAEWFGTAIPIFRFNGVIATHFPEAEADERIRAVQAELRARGRPFGWVVGPASKPSDLAARLAKHGPRHALDLRLMAVELEALAELPNSPPDLSMEKVADGEALKVWVETMAAGFEDPAWEVPHILKMEGALGLGPEQPRTHYLGRSAGQPAATSYRFLDGETAGIYNVATLRAYRGRGIGSVMTVGPLLEAREMGYRLGTLLSTPRGLGVYRKLGFKDFGALAVFVADAPGAARPTGA